MNDLSAAEKLIVFSKYIGQQVVICSLTLDRGETVGKLIGIRENALLVAIGGVNRWVPVTDEIELCDIKLLLKPLKRLTAAIIDTANSLPVQAFITPYYQSLGFDMPVYIAPGHACNCKYVYEIGLAHYRSEDEPRLKPKKLALVHA